MIIHQQEVFAPIEPLYRTVTEAQPGKQPAFLPSEGSVGGGKGPRREGRDVEGWQDKRRSGGAKRPSGLVRGTTAPSKSRAVDGWTGSAAR